MFNIHTIVSDFLTMDRVSQILRVILIFAIGLPLLKGFIRLLRKVLEEKFSAQANMVIRRAVLYSGLLILIMMALNEMGFKLSALLGAAGILGVAIGFASQTSVSNIISGIFLISEKPFIIEDTIQVGDIIGTVISIDLLSVKLKTPDNRFVRIPNEDLIKTRIYNISRFDTRVLEMKLNLPYHENLDNVEAVLMDICVSNNKSHREPKPQVWTTHFGLSGMEIQLRVWTAQEHYTILKHELLNEIKHRFDKEGITFASTLSVSAPKSGSNV